jgi:hypothetical protein
VAQTTGGEAARDPGSPLPFLAGWGGDLCELDLGADDGGVASREPLPRRGERPERLPRRHRRTHHGRRVRQPSRRSAARRWGGVEAHAYELRTGADGAQGQAVGETLR